jgi:hypothetical protein
MKPIQDSKEKKKAQRRNRQLELRVRRQLLQIKKHIRQAQTIVNNIKLPSDYGVYFRNQLSENLYNAEENRNALTRQLSA